MQSPQHFNLSILLTFLMAITVGVAVASNYYAQPLLSSITQDLNISIERSGSIVTVAQFSYALGLLFITPLGDKIERKRLIIILMLLTMVGLVICALSHSHTMLLIGTAIAGIFSAVAQVLIPFAVTLANPSHRGRVVGILMSGLLLRILLARVFAGTISSLADWRMVYWTAAVIILIITLLLYLALPRYTSQISIHYWQLITSTFILFKHEKILRQCSVLGAIAFALFSLLWTPLAFLLSDEPYYFPDFIIGLFGFAGVVGALGSPIVGRLSDKGKGKLVMTIGLLLLLFSWLPLSFSQMSIVALIAGIILIDLAVQVTHMSCLNAVYEGKAEVRSRMNAGYMFSYFLGGMIGSLCSTYLFAHYGWMAIVVIGVILACAGLAIWGMINYKQ